MVRAADPDEQQYTQTALRLDAPPTAALRARHTGS